MKKEYDYPFNRNIRTDLALEILEEEKEEIKGVNIEIEESDNKDIKVTWIEILDENGEKAMGKPVGNYFTIESESMKVNDVETHESIIKSLSKILGTIHNLKDDSKILVIGLGNWNVTPDALGPKVISKMLVTRHMKDMLPDNIKNNVRSVSAVSPGVMGITGIETAEIVKGIVDKTKPDLVIAIDALASRKTSRVNATIQISDTGISPGSGMGNRRMLLNKETLGVPVIAIGVPTVVDAATLVNDSMELMLEEMIKHSEEAAGFYKMLNNLSFDDKYVFIKEVLDPYVGNMFVTPKEVDEVIERLSNIIANGLNISLHPAIDLSDINRYIY